MESQPQQPNPRIIVESHSEIRRWRHVAAQMVAFATAIYLIGLLVLVIALEWWGERNWILSLVLYAPPQLLLLPGIALLPFALVLRPRLLFSIMAAGLIVVFGYMRPCWNSGHEANASATIALITHNVGQGDRRKFTEFVGGHQPDVILLQDARNRAASFQKSFPGFMFEHRGEFVCLSKHAIRNATVVEAPRWRGRPVAARFELAIKGKPVAFYNVHMPTPRRQFNRFLSREVVSDLVGDEEQQRLFSDYREYINVRIDLAKELGRVFAKEQLPFVVAGDFNMPDHGYIYGLFAGQMKDAFRERGSGFGYTFPGGKGIATAVFGPWLRLDYIFAGRGWRAESCRAEPGIHSQHRAVFARLFAE